MIKCSLGKNIIKKDFNEIHRAEHDRNNVRQTIFHLKKITRWEFRPETREEGNSMQMSGSTFS